MLRCPIHSVGDLLARGGTGGGARGGIGGAADGPAQENNMKVVMATLTPVVTILISTQSIK